MRAPDLFVVGAMKCGTTSLHADLSSHPRIRVAAKEAGLLATVRSERSRRAYLEQWTGAAATEALVDVSATYAMLPHLPDVAERAAELNPEAKVIYLCREPVARIISHHHHDVAGGVTGAAIDHAVREDSRFVDYTRYDTQIQPWLHHLGAGAVRILRFEDYVADRQAVVGAVTDWLGLERPPAGVVDQGEIRNATSTTRRASGRTRQLLGSRVYRDVVRPLVPGRLRAVAARQVLAAPPGRPPPPSPATLDWLHEELAGEVTRLACRTGGRVTWPGWGPE